MHRLGTKVIVATRNKGKVEEFAALFAERGIQVLSLLDTPGLPDIAEDGETFAANALIKARAVAQQLGTAALADDSGLCVDRLGGEPGVYSARYAGEPSDDAANNRKLLAELARRGEPAAAEAVDGGPRVLSPARFVCAIALVDPAGELVAAVEGTCEGMIVDAPRGGQGFGYDPLFYVPQLGRTLAELSMEEKNGLSHRGQAVRKLWSALEAAGQS